jgi:hypothetical protein
MASIQATPSAAYVNLERAGARELKFQVPVVRVALDISSPVEALGTGRNHHE